MSLLRVELRVGGDPVFGAETVSGRGAMRDTGGTRLGSQLGRGRDGGCSCSSCRSRRSRRSRLGLGCGCRSRGSLLLRGRDFECIRFFGRLGFRCLSRRFGSRSFRGRGFGGGFFLGLGVGGGTVTPFEVGLGPRPSLGLLGMRRAELGAHPRGLGASFGHGRRRTLRLLFFQNLLISLFRIHELLACVGGHPPR